MKMDPASFPDDSLGRIARWMVGALAGLYVGAAAACPVELRVWPAQVNGQALMLEVAESAEARACGLSGRESLAPDRGMLFVLPRSMSVAFSMRDTPLALAIAFLDDAGRILDIQAMMPGELDVRYRSPGPVRYAIEVNWDWFTRHEVKLGDIVNLPRSVERRAR